MYIAPPDSFHEVDVKKKNRPKSTGDPHVTLLASQNYYGFNHHHTQHDGLREGGEDWRVRERSGEVEGGEERAHNEHCSAVPEEITWGLPDESQNKDKSKQEKNDALQSPMDLQCVHVCAHWEEGCTEGHTSIMSNMW